MNWNSRMQTLHYRTLGALLIAAIAIPCHARSLDDIRRSKELRICLTSDHPASASAEPENCRDDCKFSGPHFEQASTFARSLGNGIRAKYLRVDWDEQFFNKQGKTDRDGGYTPELLASGRCDLYAGHMTKNAWRLKKLDIVTLYPGRMMVILSKPMQGKIKAAPDLAGKTTATDKDTSFHTWLQEQNQTLYAANPVTIKLMDTLKSMTAVEAGEVDFVLTDANMAIWVTRNQLKAAKAGFTVGPTEELGWAMRKDDKDLQATVQKFFDQQKANDASAFNQIWQKHYGISLNKFISIISFTR